MEFLTPHSIGSEMKPSTKANAERPAALAQEDFVLLVLGCSPECLLPHCAMPFFTHPTTTEGLNSLFVSMPPAQPKSAERRPRQKERPLETRHGQMVQKR